jgi:hypothetical protein
MALPNSWPAAKQQQQEQSIRPVVLVPTHRSQPTPQEVISLRQLARVLGKHEIVLMTPNGVNTSAYKELLPSASFLSIKKEWMQSHASYNRLIISPLLGSLFRDFSHLLLHEPDSLVLHDSLATWCQQPYDYIGAPWFTPIAGKEGEANFAKGANSGFSLFRLDAMRKVTNSWQRWYPVKHALGDIRRGLIGRPRQIARGLNGLYPGGLLRGAHQLYPSYCDQYWSLLIPSLVNDFKVAPPEVAVQFSWEKWSHLCMEYCRGHLPFGIHAWAKYDFDFLSPHLAAAGVDLTGMPKWEPPEWRKDWHPPVWPVGKVV